MLSILAAIPYRAVEIGIASMGGILVVPWLLPLLALRRLIRRTPIFQEEVIVGAGGVPLVIHRFYQVPAILGAAPLFIHLISGKLTLVGTAMTPYDQHGPAPENRYIRLVKPGIFSLWQVRQAGKIAHEGKTAIEWEYIFQKKPLYDFLLLLRTIPALFYRDEPSSTSPILRLFDLDIENRTMDEAVSLMEGTMDRDEQRSVFFVNPDCLNKIFSDSDYFNVLKQGDHIFPDGIGLTIAGKILQSPLRENINGTDMLPFICRMAARRNRSLFLLGARPGTAEKMAERIHEEYGVRIAGHAHGYFDHETGSDEIVSTINRSGADILLVAFGAPRQETWIAAHRHALEPRILMGVGGLFDFYSGNTRRAPSWVRELGLEWCYRILQEPGRMWKRYVIGNPVFLYRVTRWKLFSLQVTPKNG